MAIMPSAEPETDSHDTKSGQIDHQAPVEDPIDELIENLRDQFKRGHIHRAAQKKAVKYKRTRILIALIALVGIVGAAALVEIAIHRLR
jgi:hypothetical protein